MDLETFKEEIESYLPIDFYDEDNNNYKEYLLSALEENYCHGKYQFCIIAANILFMCCICKKFYFLKLNGDTISYDSGMRPDIFESANTMFDLSEYDEKKSIYACLKTLHVHVNEIDDAKEIINKRNHCAHVCGKIQYGKKETHHFFESIISKLELAQEKCNKRMVEKLFKDFNDHIKKTQDVKTFVLDMLKKYSLSINECLEIRNALYKREGNTITDSLLKCLMFYHLGKIMECFNQAENVDNVLIDELRGLIAEDPSQKNNIFATIESDFTNGNQEFWDVIPFDEINKQLETSCNKEREPEMPSGNANHNTQNLLMDVFIEVAKGENKDD